ncbi:MAG: hypothetical protein H6817_01995 [Phycisphaerales bacterium]|nr:hypothetical protein [Phycisphaerales bacterium]
MRKAADTATRLWVAPEFANCFARGGLHTLDDLFTVHAAHNLHKDTLPPWRERVAIDLVDDAGVTQRFYVKRFHTPPRKSRAQSPPGSSDICSVAGVERHWLLTVGAAGNPVPRLAAFAEEVVGGSEVRSALVLADVGGTSLEKWAGERETPAPRVLIDAVAQLSRRFHDGGFIHRDYYLAHIFLTNGDVGAPELAIIDLQRIMLRPWRLTRWRAHDLAQLDYSTPPRVAGTRARLRFLKRYLGGASLKSRTARAWMRRITRMSAQIAARDARRRNRAASTEAGS